MSGTYVVKRGSRFYVVQYVGVDPATRKKRRKWHSGFSNRREAETFRVTLASHPLYSAGQGIYGSTRERLGDYLRDYLGSLILRPKTRETYEMFAEVYIRPELGHVPLVRLSPQTIERFQRKTQEGRSPTTVRHTMQLLRQALDKAVRMGKIVRNPIEQVDLVKRARRERDVWTVEQATKFLDLARRSSPYRLIYELALTSGMRQGEIFGLRWQDLDLTGGIVRVRQTLEKPGSEPVFGEPKTKKSRRAILLPEPMVAELRAWRAQQNAARLKAGPSWHDYDLVFSANDGKPLHPHNVVRRDFHTIIEQARLPQITFHDLRHVHVTALVAAGVDVRTVADRVGHSRASMTLDIYTHSTPALQERAAAASSTFLTLEGPTEAGHPPGGVN